MNKKTIIIVGVLIVALLGVRGFVIYKNNIASAGQGIHGKVSFGPTCPVQRIPPDPNCADKPYANKEVTATSATGQKYKAPTDATGSFSINLPIGTYTVSVASGNVLPRCSEQQSVVVTSGKFTYAGISCDTGIR